MAARGTDGMTGGRLSRTAAMLRPVGGLGERVRSAGSGRALPVWLAAVFVLSAIVAGYFGVQVYRQHQEERREEAIMAAARQSAVNFTSFDYKNYARDSKNVLDNATGEFRKQFTAQAKELTKLVAKNKSVSEGQVLEAGIARADDRSARVLVVADSRVTNVAAPKGQVRNYRLQLDLVNEGGRWLTSNVEFVG